MVKIFSFISALLRGHIGIKRKLRLCYVLRVLKHFLIFLVMALAFGMILVENLEQNLHDSSFNTRYRDETVSRDSLGTNDVKSSFENMEIRNITKSPNVSKIQDSSLCQQRFPSVLIVGFAKCGTGALIQFLDIHPDIAAVIPAELNFFNHRFHRGVEWYKSQMPCSLPNQLTVEKTPGYARSLAAPRRVFQTNSNMKIIFLVRDPVQALISYYTMKQLDFGYREPLSSYILDSSGNIRSQFLWVDDYIYLKHIQKWLKYFDLKNIKIVDGENFAKHPVEELKQLEMFLNIKPFFMEDHFIFNKTKGFYCLNEDGKMCCMLPKKGRKHSEIDEQLLQQLYRFYEDDNDKLFQFLGRRFNWTYH